MLLGKTGTQGRQRRMKTLVAQRMGGGLGRSEADIGELCPRASISKGLAIEASLLASRREGIADWLRAELGRGAAARGRMP